MLYGIDSNSPSTDVIAALPTLKTTQVPDWVWNDAAGQSAGDVISFVMRYLTNHGGANLNITEVLALSDQQLRAVSIYEAGASFGDNPGDTGYRHGTEAWTAAARVSQPLGTPIYFAVDFSPAPSDLGQVTDYFDGVRRSLNDYNTAQSAPAGTDMYAIGVYGQPHVCTHCRDTDLPSMPGTKLATWFWRWGGPRTEAWPGANVRQLYGEQFYGRTTDTTLHFINPTTGHVVGEKFCGLSVDFDIADVETLDQVGAWLIPPAPPQDDSSNQ